MNVLTFFFAAVSLFSQENTDCSCYKMVAKSPLTGEKFIMSKVVHIRSSQHLLIFNDYFRQFVTPLDYMHTSFSAYRIEGFERLNTLKEISLSSFIKPGHIEKDSIFVLNIGNRINHCSKVQVVLKDGNGKVVNTIEVAFQNYGFKIAKGIIESIDIKYYRPFLAEKFESTNPNPAWFVINGLKVPSSAKILKFRFKELDLDTGFFTFHFPSKGFSFVKSKKNGSLVKIRFKDGKWLKLVSEDCNSESFRYRMKTIVKGFKTLISQ